ncbi:MAG: metallophosphoesterase [Saprospiraceae bacterium]|nr:metallophosphoesterase [Saprospiraceae bacterium]
MQQIPSANKPWSKLPLNNDPDKFQFAIVTDRTGGHRPGVFEYGVSRLNLLQPEFVLSVGDLIEGYTEDTTELNRQWTEFNGFINDLEMPFFYVAGNHDYTNPTMVNLWRKQFGVDYYHFVYKNVLFLCLNSEEGATALKDPDFTDEQVAFVKKTLDANPNVRWTLVFMHQPLWLRESGKNWLRVEELLSTRKHSVFTGHLHQYALHDRNRTDYFVLATTGGGTPLRGKRRGEFDHIMWVTMTDNGPYYANIMLDGIEDKNIATYDKISWLRKLDANPPVKVLPFFYDEAVAADLSAKILLKNELQEVQKYAIAFESNSTLMTSEQMIEKTLQPGQQEEWTLNMNRIGKGEMKPLVANVLIKGDQYEWDSKLNIIPNKKYYVNKTKTAPQIDGDLKDWGKLRFTKTSEKGDGTFSFDVREDGKFLYVGIDVEDEDYQAGFGHSHLDQDGAFFIFDARPIEISAYNRREESGALNGEWFFLSANPTADNFELGFKELLPPGVMGKGKKTAKGYMVEYAVPIALLNKMQGGDWKNLRLNVSILDKDNGDKQAMQYNWLPDWTQNFPGSGTFFKK